MQKIMGRWQGWSVHCYKAREVLRIAEYTETCFKAAFKDPSECYDIPAPPFVRAGADGPFEEGHLSHELSDGDGEAPPARKRRRLLQPS